MPALKAAAQRALKGSSAFTEIPWFSTDMMHNPKLDCRFPGCTKVMEGNLVKVVSWYDNEWGYSKCACVDLVA